MAFAVYETDYLTTSALRGGGLHPLREAVIMTRAWIRTQSAVICYTMYMSMYSLYYKYEKTDHLILEGE